MKMGTGSRRLGESGRGSEAVVGFGAFSPKRTWPDLGSTHVEPDPVAPRPPGEHEEETAPTPRGPPAGPDANRPRSRYGLDPLVLCRPGRPQEDRRRLRPPGRTGGAGR